MFERTIKLLGEEKFNKIKNSTIMVLGIGGVGSYAVETLVRSGIGHIIIVDADKVDITNLNRQLMTNQDNIGEYKTDVFEKRINAINPTCKVTKITEFITEENINILFQEKVDFIIDAIDTMKTKKMLLKECLKRNIKFIISTGMGNKIDASKVKITDLSKTSYDKIAKSLREFVKKEKINAKIPVVFSDEESIKCDIISSIAFVPATAGILAANYVIKEIIK